MNTKGMQWPLKFFPATQGKFNLTKIERLLLETSGLQRVSNISNIHDTSLVTLQN